MDNFKSPLLFPVSIDGEKIKVLDETSLPWKEDYILVENLEDSLRVLSEMKTRSLGQVFLFFYSCVLFSKDKTILDIAKEFKSRRPTFDFLKLAELLEFFNQKTKDTKKSTFYFIDNFDKARRKRAKFIASTLDDNCNILTICNVNGELIYLAEEMEILGKKVFFYVSETRPYLQGSRLTFWELKKAGIKCQIICDNQAGYLMENKLVNLVLTGADRASIRGGIINKVGTYSLAVLAKYFKIPFYSLVQYPRDIDIESIEIEERDPKEVFMFLEEIQSDAIYPAFDIVSKELITGVFDLIIS